MIELLNIDCLEYMKTVSDNWFDLAIVDPPYGVAIEKREDINAASGKIWDNKTPGKEYFDELFRVSKKQIIWGLNRFIEHLPNCSMTIIWDKENGENYMSDYELAWCNLGYNRSRIFRMFWISNMIPANEKPRIHSCQKPIKLYKWILKNYAKDGEKIFDSHLGSGSIAIACHDFKFNLVGCEIDIEYYEAASKRLKNHQAQLKIF